MKKVKRAVKKIDKSVVRKGEMSAAKTARLKKAIADFDKSMVRKGEKRRKK